LELPHIIDRNSQHKNQGRTALRFVKRSINSFVVFSLGFAKCIKAD